MDTQKMDRSPPGTNPGFSFGTRLAVPQRPLTATSYSGDTTPGILGEMISVSEAHNRWGDLARIRRGHTFWISVNTPEGLWSPLFSDDGILLLGYQKTT